jgi:hypothetical protein
MIDRHGSEIGNFHHRKMRRYSTNTSSRHAGSHSLGITGTAAVMAIAAAGSAHAGGHIHHLDAHGARLNRGQAHSRSHEDCEQQDKYPPDQQMRHGNLQLGGNVWQNQAMFTRMRLGGTAKARERRVSAYDRVNGLQREYT